MSVTIEVDKTSVDNLYKRLGKKMGGKVLVKAMVYGAQPLIKTARSIAPKSNKQAWLTAHRHVSKGNVGIKYNKHRPGDLKRGIWYKVNRKYPPAVFVGPDRKNNINAFYSRFVEYGTKNMSAQPYMRPAWDQTRKIVENRIKDYLTQFVRTEFVKNLRLK